jgi:hypothetical protein
MPTFNAEHPDQLTYETTYLHFTVLGGLRLDYLDRMRVTLKVEVPESVMPPLRHNLDLYNDLQTEKFTRKIAERLEVGVSIATETLSDLTSELENYRLQQLRKREEDTTPAYQMTEAERSAALGFLSGGNLMERTNELIGQSGILGEVDNRLLMYLIFTTRKRSNPLHVVSLGASGTGKTHLQERVAELIPEEDKIEITTLTENAFYYFERNALSHKLILIEDLDGADSSFYAIRELQSKKRITKTVALKNSRGETRTTQLVVEGPVCVAGCTTKERIYEDNANRSFLLYLDESYDQDKHIMDYQRAISAGKINEQQEREAQQLLKNAQRLLEPVKVVNPYAELLHIPPEVLKPRRTNAHYLQFIEAVTFYHQHQRAMIADQLTGEVYIETTLDDIAAANRLLKHVLLRKSDQLTGACRNHFESLKLYLVGENQKGARSAEAGRSAEFTNVQIAQLFRKPITTVKRYHLELMQCGYLKTRKTKGSKMLWYSVVSYEEYEQLQQRIQSVLDDCLETVRASVSGSEVLTPGSQILDSKQEKLAMKSSAANRGKGKKAADVLP